MVKLWSTVAESFAVQATGFAIVACCAYIFISDRQQSAVTVKRHDQNHSGFPTNNNNNTRLMALCLRLPGWAGTRKVKPIWILLKQETVSGSGINWAICKCGEIRLVLASIAVIYWAMNTETPLKLWPYGTIETCLLLLLIYYYYHCWYHYDHPIPVGISYGKCCYLLIEICIHHFITKNRKLLIWLC